MKNLFKTLLSASIVLLITSCNQNSPAPAVSSGNNNSSTCNLNLSYLKDVIWYHISNPAVFANLKYESSGSYVENGVNVGTWSSINNCDSIKLVKNGNTWKTKIFTLTQDTLVLVNPVFGNQKYRK